MIIRENCGEKLSDPAATARLLQSILQTEEEIDREKEHFWVIGLNTKNVVKYVELVSLGNLNTSIVHPREVFRLAIMKGVNSIIVGHNHPSGDIEPSQDDIAITSRLAEGGKILGIKVLDHVIVTENNFYSMRQAGRMPAD